MVPPVVFDSSVRRWRWRGRRAIQVWSQPEPRIGRLSSRADPCILRYSSAPSPDTPNGVPKNRSCEGPPTSEDLLVTRTPLEQREVLVAVPRNSLYWCHCPSRFPGGHGEGWREEGQAGDGRAGYATLYPPFRAATPPCGWHHRHARRTWPTPPAGLAKRTSTRSPGIIINITH